jgi:hypothetical protein
VADNLNLTALSGNVATDEVTYSGDTAGVQLTRNVRVIGAEGAKTVTEPVLGGIATTSISAEALAANDAVVEAHVGSDRVLIVRQDCNLEDVVTGTNSNTDGTSTELIAAQGANIKTYLTAVCLYNSSASGVVVVLKDGTTAKKSFFVPATGGLIRQFRTPLAGTANTAWNFDPAGATTTIYCNGEGFRSRV